MPSQYPKDYLDPITCPEHNELVYPKIGKNGYRYYKCDVEIIHLHNGNIGKSHFIQDPDYDIEFDAGYQNQFDVDYPRVHEE